MMKVIPPLSVAFLLCVERVVLEGKWIDFVQFSPTAKRVGVLLEGLQVGLEVRENGRHGVHPQQPNARLCRPFTRIPCPGFFQ
jgi:hypothetical protein